MKADVRRVVVVRGLRGFADGLVSVLLARYLTEIGFSPLQVGAIVTATLVGSAALTLAVGLSGAGMRRSVRTLLVFASALMIATGVGFATVTVFAGLVVVALLGTLNPSGGDVSVFLPTEQAYLAGEVDSAERPRLYAIYNLAGALCGAVGALVSAVPDDASSMRWAFVLYAGVGAVVLVLYRRVGEDVSGPSATRGSLRESRRIVVRLAALFSLDSAGSGFVVTSLLVLWLSLRFDLSGRTTGGVFFVAGLLASTSQLAAARLAARIGLVRTMVFTHLPANAMLVVAAFAPTAWIAVGALLVRALTSQMDVPARQALVMSVVPAAERAAASSVTNVPRSLASATTPLLAGALLSASSFGWPLVIAGLSKITYDLLLLWQFAGIESVEGIDENA